MGGIIMNENLDLTKILDGCPEGTMFYSPLFGHLIFCGIRQNILFTDEDNNPLSFYPNGIYYSSYKDAECMVFPSKEQRNWSKFERFWDKPKVEKFDPKTLQPFDKVLLRIDERDIWQPDFFGYKDGNCITCVTYGNIKCIPYNEETKHLVGKRDDCPEYYKWWEE